MGADSGLGNKVAGLRGRVRPCRRPWSWRWQLPPAIPRGLGPLPALSGRRAAAPQLSRLGHAGCPGDFVGWARLRDSGVTRASLGLGDAEKPLEFLMLDASVHCLTSFQKLCSCSLEGDLLDH